MKTAALFYRPAEMSADWARTDLWEHASSIPGVEALSDEDGLEARRLGSSTSGQVLLYDASGALVFHGGITLSRGHSGDNAGRSAILDLLAGDTPDHVETSVFGCPITADHCPTAAAPAEGLP